MLSFRFPPTPVSEATRARQRRSLLLAVVLVSVLPLAWRGTSCGQDFDFHLQNWLEVAAHWHEGVFYPNWAGTANFLAGEPRFVFYPPLSWMLGGLLGVLMPWSWTPLAFTLAALLGAGYSLRAMAREWIPQDNATIAACLYVVNPYMLFVAYERGAMAELLAATWIPLLVLFGLRQRSSLVSLALTVAAIWLTNAPAAVMGSYMLAVLVVAASFQEKSWRLAGRAAAAVPLGLGLAGFWLIPAIYEQGWVEIARAIGPLMRVEDSFLFGYVKVSAMAAADMSDLIYHNQVLHTVSWIVVTLMAGSAAGAWNAWRKRSAIWLPLVVIGAGVCALQLSWSDWIWRIAPKLAYLQFPWRWMLVLGMVFAAMTGLGVRGEAATRRAIALRAAAILLLSAGMAALSTAFFWQPCDEEDNVRAQIAAFHSSGFEGTDEYTPQGADNSQIQQGTPAVVMVNAPDAPLSGVSASALPERGTAGAISIERWDTERKTAIVTATGPGYAILRLMDYPAWRVTRNGGDVKDRALRSDGLMAIPVTAGVNQIEVEWRKTSDQWAGIELSAASLAITLILAWTERRKTRELPIR